MQCGIEHTIRFTLQSSYCSRIWLHKSAYFFSSALGTIHLNICRVLLNRLSFFTLDIYRSTVLFVAKVMGSNTLSRRMNKIPIKKPHPNVVFAEFAPLRLPFLFLYPFLVFLLSV
jgi:hypothetical protein